ncbi:MAG: hypothetical protein NT042_03415 [Sulfuritalea sp.]|nr:hypothetical protein [Sulfuritalea sp.]
MFLRSSARRKIGEREDDPHQRNAVGDAVMDAGDQCRTTFVILDQVEAPQRLSWIEWLHGEFAGQRLQFLLAGLVRQDAALEVCVDIEIGIVLPEGAGDLLYRALAKAPVASDQASFDGIAQTVEIHPLLEYHDTDNHHQIGRAVHSQPSRIDGRHFFTS